MDYYGSVPRSKKMLKHTTSHYGQTGVPLSLGQPGPHPLITPGDISHQNSLPHQHQHQHSTSQPATLDPTRFLEGPTHIQNKSYVDHQSYQSGGAHTPSRSIFMDTSRIPRILSENIRKDDLKGINGSIYFTPNSPQNIIQTPPGKSNHSPSTNPNTSGTTNTTTANDSANSSSASKNTPSFRHSVLRSLALLSILSLLLALNSLVFLLKIVWPFEPGHSLSNDASQMQMMYELTLCLSAMSLSINLCVLLVCSAQYMFAISGTPSSTSFLRKVSLTRGIAIGGFFLSVPLFLSAIVLYTFTHLTLSTTALISTACVGGSIIFGGCAMIWHVYSWQKEKTNKHLSVLQSQSPSYSHNLELSTLV